MYPNSRITLNRAPNLRWQAFCVIIGLALYDLQYHIYIFFLSPSFSAPVIVPLFVTSHCCHNLIPPVKPEISIRGERQNQRLFFTACNGKVWAFFCFFVFFLTVAFFSFLYLLLQLTPTKLCSQLRHQIEHHVAKGHT